jgi:hypothetical protein
VDGAALPGAAQDFGDRRLQAGVRVADRELDADQAVRDEAVQNASVSVLADVDREDFPLAGLMDATRS